MRHSRGWMFVVFAGAIAQCGAATASAQVKISMPPPPPSKRVVDETPPATVQTTGTPGMTAAIPVGTPVASSPMEGDIALARYAQARTGTYDTYFNDGTYWNNGIHYVSYPNYIPQFVWGPWWGWGWGSWGGGWGGCW